MGTAAAEAKKEGGEGGTKNGSFHIQRSRARGFFCTGTVGLVTS